MKKAFIFCVCSLLSLFCTAQWSLTGNLSTNPSTNFVGTTDAQPFVFRTNSTERLRITLNGRLLTNGTNNNLFIGLLSGNETTSGLGFNVGFGNNTLQANTSGFNNIAVGGQALQANMTGRDNFAIGFQSLYTNVNGIRNVALGSLAMFYNNSGNDNVSIGTLSLWNNNSGTGNTVVGYFAMPTNTTGSNNTIIGNAADVTVNNLTNATAIGYNARVAASNALILGATGANQVNVGIGVTNPGARLEINSSTAGVSGIRLSQMNSNSSVSAANGKALSVNSTGNIILVPVVAADGSGTKVTAGVNISVAGLGTVASPYIVSSNFPWTASGIGAGNIINANSGAIVIGTGITSLNGGYKLYVSSGGILTEKIKAALKTSAHWQDCVFEDDYKLLSLSEVECFVKSNKHLPNIPSGQELVEQGGIDMVEMFSKQMGKIEELTLYMIQMQKQIDELKRQNEKLKASHH